MKSKGIKTYRIEPPDVTDTKRRYYESKQLNINKLDINTKYKFIAVASCEIMSVQSKTHEITTSNTISLILSDISEQVF